MDRLIPKVYRSTKSPSDDGGWHHEEIRLEPDSDAGGYEPIVLTETAEEAVLVVGELVEVLGGEPLDD